MPPGIPPGMTPCCGLAWVCGLEAGGGGVAACSWPPQALIRIKAKKIDAIVPKRFISPPVLRPRRSRLPLRTSLLHVRCHRGPRTAGDDPVDAGNKKRHL